MSKSPPHDAFIQALRAELAPQQLLTELPQRLAYSSDASFYHMVPKAVVRVGQVAQLARIMSLAQSHQVAVTFRAAGTSLSGQAVTDSVLVLLDEQWRQAEVLDNGQRIRLQPGVIGAQANRLLAPYGKKIGPDPASINACKVGGIAANNASGMCCGVKHNSYHTLADMSLILADGTVLNTADEDSVAAFRDSHQGLLHELSQLRQQMLADDALVARVRHKYRLKNTTGYGINALLDYDDPLAILTHLMIGSEGTLGFIAEITYHTVPVPAHRAAGLFVFEDIHHCCAAVPELSELTVNAVELLDARALRSVQDKPGMPNIDGLSTRGAALLIEVGGDDCEQLRSRCRQVEDCLDRHSARFAEVAFSQDERVIDGLWQIRKGTFPAVGAVRESGTTVIIEDVAFDVSQLAEGVTALQGLFEQFGYDEAIIFGHALDGNVHFVFTQGFDSQQDVERYDALMQAVNDIVVTRFDGSLKAEHGTGRNMAPFVQHEWGEAAYGVMTRIKALLDPNGILNPGVILNDDPQAHLKHLKTMPDVDENVDTCIECGFCEPVCPSKDLTLTPRQRIAVQRRANDLSESERLELEAFYRYQGIDSCAATGMCATRCPVGINTGDYIKALRAKSVSPLHAKLGNMAAKHFSSVAGIARFGLKAGHWVQQQGLNLTGAKRPPLPSAATPLVRYGHGSKSTVRAIYVPACINRVMGADDEMPPLADVVQSLFRKAGADCVIPDHIDDLCCGMPFDSQGLPQEAADKAQQWQALMNDPNVPLVIDASPCASQLKHAHPDKPIYDISEYVAKVLLPHLNLNLLPIKVALHKTCSSRRMGVDEQLEALARACAEQVIVPDDMECCGFAGSKGFTTPELNASALRSLPSALPDDVDYGVSNSRTCEIGLSHHSGVPYRSVLYLVDQAAE